MRRGSAWMLCLGFVLSTELGRAQDGPWFEEDSTPPARSADPTPEPSAAPVGASESTDEGASDAEPRREAPKASRHSKGRAARADRPAARKAESEWGPPTLLGHDGKIAFGGYGGVTVLGSRVNGTWGALVGGEAAFLLDHRLAIGFSGVGLASQVEGPPASDGTLSRVQFGYGGVMLELNLLGSSPVYVAVGGMAGAGGVAFCGHGPHRYDLDCRQENLDESAFFVAEPRIGLRANVTRWMRLGVDARYRFTQGVDTRGLDDSEFSGASVGGSVQFGWF